MRGDRVQESKRYVAVAIVIAGLDEDGEFEVAASLPAGLGGGHDEPPRHTAICAMATVLHVFGHRLRTDPT